MKRHTGLVLHTGNSFPFQSQLPPTEVGGLKRLALAMSANRD